ncbi:MAG: PDZ domain-containing protein [Nitrospirae bacterium]|nr:PDZ domain-containing protein [Nitrospirota bacterium]
MIRPQGWMVLVRLLLIGAGAFIAADGVNQWLVGSWRVGASQAASTATAPAAGQPPKPMANYPQVTHRNIFDSSPPRPGEPARPMPTDAGPVAPVIAPLNLNVRLTGTVVGVTADQSYAFILDVAKRDESLYKVGDRILAEAVVASIGRDEVRLVRGGAEQILRMFAAEAEPEPVAVSAVPSAVGAVDVGVYQIDRGEVEEALTDIPKLLTQARLLPNFRAGVTDGFRIFNIVPDSLFAKIGLQNGDVLHRINDVEIKDPTKFMEVFNDLRDASSITLDLVRGKDRKTIEYEIR